ncbi:restriction endonuclease subunit S [Neptunicella sp. SCSIO 80796]|uniref:restriction endonuclease subunit S n=1 Tax=Neptunicella plasticusilytica TaxID=3117012 RepID=UPI003A4DB44E
MSKWKRKKIGDILTLEYGKPLDKSLRVDNGNYPAYGANGVKCRTNEYYCDKQTIIVGRKGSAGEIILTEEKFWPLDVTYFVTFDDSLYDLKFIFWLLKKLNLPSLATGVKPGINRNNVYNIEVEIPEIEEQKQIVARLDQAFSAIEKACETAEQNLRNAKELFDCYVVEVFSKIDSSWLHLKMSEVCVGTITDGTHQTPKYFDEGYIFLSSKNVTTGEIDWENVRYLDETQHIKMQKRLSPKLNDILLAKNGTTGVAAIVDREVVFDIYVSLALLRPSEMIEPRYLLHFVNSPLAKKQFDKRLKGIGVPNLHLKEIRDVVVSLPSSRESQQEIVAKIDMLLEHQKELQKIYYRKLQKLEELKASILQSALNGELTKSKGAAA